MCGLRLTANIYPCPFECHERGSRLLCIERTDRMGSREYVLRSVIDSAGTTEKKRVFRPGRKVVSR
jgi:hypothetical protein